MNTKTKIRKFVDEHRVLTHYYAFCAGSIVTSAAILYFSKDRTLLNVTANQLQMLKEGGAVVYELKDQTLHLVNIAAVEATL